MTPALERPGVPLVLVFAALLAGCTPKVPAAAHAGREARVDYTADYYFYAP